MSLEIILIRHGESEANVASVWQGQGDSALSDAGREQAKLLAERMSAEQVDLIVASDLARARDTAAAIFPNVEIDPSWREMNLGGWEGLTFEEVKEHHPDLLESIRNGEAVAFGGTGETVAEFEARVTGAFDRLAERVGDGRVAVVTHGGVIDALVGRALGRVKGRRSVPVVANTAITVFVGEPGRMRLGTFNDAAHIGLEVGYLARARSEGVPVVGFVRHAVTAANKESRIQGQSCWGLDEEGHRQAEAFASWYGPVDRVISSPLRRAKETAQAVSGRLEEEPAVQEMSFGSWEGMLTPELRASDDPLARRIFGEGEDLPRGHTGETMADLIERVSGFLARLEVDPDERTLVVSHGGAIRALVASIVDRPELAHHVVAPANASVSHVALSEHGPLLVDFSVTPPSWEG